MISCDTHVIRKALRLSLNEMAVLCDIHQMSQNPKYGYWCVKSKDKMSEWLDLSRDTVFRAIKTLKDKGYVISNNEGHLKCTQFIFDIESAQDEIAIFIRNNDTELITAKMQELIQSENHTQSEIATIPSENRTNDRLKIRPTPSENHTLDIQETYKEKENKDNYVLFVEFLNEKLNRGFRTNSASLRAAFNKRMKQGWVLQNFKDAVIEAMKMKNHIESNFRYLTPEFFTRETTLDRYATSKGTSNSGSVPTEYPNVFYHAASGTYWQEYVDGKKYVCQKRGSFEYNNDGTKIPFNP